MRQADFAGPRRSGAASDKPRIRYRVVRSAKRPARQQSDAARKQPGDAMDLRGLYRFLKSQWRQDSGEALREHRFTGAWRADHQNIVPAGRSHFQSTLGAGLATDIAEIRKRLIRSLRRCG